MIPDGEMQAVVRAQLEVSDEKIRHHRVEQMLGLPERREGGHQQPLSGEQLFGVTKSSWVGVDEDNERGHAAFC